MAFDGIVLSAVVNELRNSITGSRIAKIFQPAKKDLLIYIHTRTEENRLYISANSSHPMVHLAEMAIDRPPVPPMFCMLLRKHLAGGKIIDITQPGLERIVEIKIESFNELGIRTSKNLMVEIMGRHSNIILTNDEYVIIDAVKRIPVSLSRVRQVLPGLVYKYPPSGNKINPLHLDESKFTAILKNSKESISAAIIGNFTGMGSVMAREIPAAAGLSPDRNACSLSDAEYNAIAGAFSEITGKVKKAAFSPSIYFDTRGKAIEFHALPLKQYDTCKTVPYSTVGKTVEQFYKIRKKESKFNQFRSDLTKQISRALDHCKKKLALYDDKLSQTVDMEKFKLYGELITANIYRISPRAESVCVENYYTGREVNIPLNPSRSPSENAGRYYKRYTKARNTRSALKGLISKARSDMEYLEGVLYEIDLCENIAELHEVRDEVKKHGTIYIKARTKDTVKPGKKPARISKPLHFVSSDGIDIYVGKNNRQNDLLTLRTASSSDTWLHTKNIPGSHVILKTKGRKQSETMEIPPRTLEEAAMLAAYYSKARMSSSVPVDYTIIKNVKKPSGAKPGMVIYENYRTIYITPEKEYIEKIKQIKQVTT